MSSLLSLVSAGTQGSISLSRSKDLLSTRIRVRSRALAADLGMLSSVSLSSLSCSLRLPMSPGSGLLVITDQCRVVQECRRRQGAATGHWSLCVCGAHQSETRSPGGGRGGTGDLRLYFPKMCQVLQYLEKRLANCFYDLHLHCDILLSIIIII